MTLRLRRPARRLRDLRPRARSRRAAHRAHRGAHLRRCGERPHRAAKSARPALSFKIDSRVNRGRAPLRAAVVQTNSDADRDRNLEVADRLVRRAAADRAEIVVLPEKFNVLGAPDDLVAGAEPLDGPTLSWASALAGELGIWLVAGSIVERAGDERLHNTSVLVSPDGDHAAIYRKIHLFDVEVEGVAYRESDVESPGQRDHGRRRRRADAGSRGLLRPAVPRAVPDHGAAGRARVLAPGGVHGADRPRPLGDPDSRSRDREPGVRAGRRAVRAVTRTTRRATATR